MQPFRDKFHATVAAPGSKSLTNRALVLAALSIHHCKLTNVLFADDTRVMLAALQQLGFELAIDELNRMVNVTGTAGKIPAANAKLFCGNSGTTIRFLTALCSLGQGQYQLDGIERMRQRPIGQLVDLLRTIGTPVNYLATEGFPPVQVNADGFAGGTTRYSSAASSQFLSAVLMVGPYAKNELIVNLEGEQSSWPYIWMTMRLMDQFGVTPELLRDRDTGAAKQIAVPGGAYTATSYNIEPDASNAAYFLAIAAMHEGCSVTIPGLGTTSLQGDVEFGKVLARVGANVNLTRDAMTVTGGSTLRGIDVSLLDMPDQAQTLAVLALFADGPTTIRGLHSLRHKETDRLAALSTELQKLGAGVSIEGDDSITIAPPKRIRPAEIDTYDDHRMAMSFAMAGTRTDGIVIKNAECVNKTFPDYFRVLARVCP